MVTERHAGFVRGEAVVCATCAGEGLNHLVLSCVAHIAATGGMLTNALTLC